MRRATPLTFLVAVALSSSAPVASAEWGWENDRLQLKLAAGVTIEEINADYETTTSDALHPLYLLQTAPGMYSQIIFDMESDSRVEWAEPSYLDETPETTRQMPVAVVGETVEGFHDQDVYSRIRLDEVHTHLDGSGVKVAIIDTGVDWDHEALGGAVWFEGPDYIDNDSDPDDTANGLDDDDDGVVDEGAGHGTMVAGIVHLAAPGATILPIRALDDEGRGISFDVAKGIRHAVTEGADIINMSFGLLTHCETIAHEIAAAQAAGVVMVAAAGNDGSENPPYYPAIDPAVVSVAGLDANDVKASFSNFHTQVGTSAPGEGILSPFYDGQYAIGAGTSFATPFISGQAALILEGSQDADKEDVEAILRDGVINIYNTSGNEPYLGKLGLGRVDGLTTWQVIQPAASVESSAAPSLASISPNPARTGETTVVSWSSHVNDLGAEAQVVNASGQEVVRLPVRGNAVSWDGTNAQGQNVSSGAYFVRLPDVTGAAVRIIRID